MTSSPFVRSVAGIAATGAAVLAWGTLVEPRLFALRRYTLPVLRAGSLPVRVLQLSDIHMVPGQRAKAEWIRSLAALEPDLVVNTGDNLSHLEAVPAALAAMGPLLERPGVFVMGSNDYHAPVLKNPARYLTTNHAEIVGRRIALPTDELRSGMTERGWVDLDNARTSITVGADRLDLVGVDDPHIHRDDYAAVSAPADPTATTTIGVTHAPYRRVLDAMTGDGARLVIAGHTHGGQLCVPGYGALVTNCDLDRRRAKGVSRWWPGAGRAGSGPDDAAWLHVSAGLGASRFAPVRFACRPEATLMTLVPEGLDR
ncbi:metallophosphoesterase [Janibacter terrae]|uniref:metallophosphoesterase n=1 Tax=Janibacter terrae TaxID=103817 RepID=UPI0008308A6E|nr:metallophosphoesterase [Janibacter terrae]HBO55313.1 metallophosphoesterase [Janibacter terrae]